MAKELNGDSNRFFARNMQKNGCCPHLILQKTVAVPILLKGTRP
jgi:hypothetical protein